MIGKDMERWRECKEKEEGIWREGPKEKDGGTQWLMAGEGELQNKHLANSLLI